MKDIYLPIHEARAALIRRQSDQHLRNRVIEFLGGDIPEMPVSERPLAFFCRQLATCRNEDLAFISTAVGAGFKPLWLLYEGDKFYSVNREKVTYCRPLTAQPTGPPQKVRLVKLGPHTEGRPLNTLSTKAIHDNKPIGLVHFHHRLRQEIIPEHASSWIENTNWFQRQAKRAIVRHNAKSDDSQQDTTLPSSISRYYYPAYLALAISHGILIEEFHAGPNDESRAEFLSDILYPALETVEAATGCAPLIVQLPWQAHFAEYPVSVNPILERYGLK